MENSPPRFSPRTWLRPLMSAASTPARETTPPSPLPRRRRLHAYRWFFTFAGAVLGLDQLTKLLVILNLPLNTYGPPGHVAIIPGFFNLVHVGNTGAAWSLFSGRSTLLALLAVTTLLGIFFWRRSLGLRILPVQISFGLLCGGIVGNLIDRLVHGHVVDFLDFHFGNYVYPTFNIADSGICIGVVIYLWYSFTTPETKE